ncbi:BnaC07g32830D [Brassica napus]|nr:BnaC07g32830D [Brassica napus]
MLMSFVDSDEPYKYALISSSHDPVPLISPFYPAPMYDLDQDLTMPRIGGCFVSALRGLLCVRLLRSVRICNLTTMQRVTLPIITSRIVPENNENIWSYFGHEPVHDEYKVLSTVWEVSEEEKVVRSEHQVLVLGHGASWRSTRSTIPPPPHCPYMHGISINGVLYYGAWVDKNRCVVMSFDMRYEDIDLWFVQDAGKSGWSDKKSFVLPIFETRTLSMASRLLIQPTSHSSEICLKPEEINRHNPRCVIYDLERCKITRLINGMRIVDRFWGSTFMETTFWDDIESIMYLET